MLIETSQGERATGDVARCRGDLDSGWVKQLRKRGVDARAWHALLPGGSAADEQSVVEVVKGHAIDTVLVSKLVQTKTVELEASLNAKIWSTDSSASAAG